MHSASSSDTARDGWRLPAIPANIHWGFFDQSLAPALTVPSGAVVSVETLTHHAGDAPDLLMDEATATIFDRVTDRGPGPHILTGPIAVDGAAPGDVLEVRILSLEPRLHYGSNLAAHWGHLYRDFAKERVTVWSIDRPTMTARAEFAFDWKTTPLADAPGTIVPPGSVPREPALAEVIVALRPHLGTMGVAPAAPGRHSSIPPGLHGGNIDNWRAGPGTSMHYPVAMPGALLSMGDPHLSQGDGEISGTALEASLDVVLQVRLRRDLPIDVPVLETPTHWYVHGFGDTLDEAMTDAARGQLRFLGKMLGLTADDAYSVMSVGGDFTVTQVVDQRQGGPRRHRQNRGGRPEVSASPIRPWTFPPGMGVPVPSGAYAHATAHGSTLYITGQLPMDPVSGTLMEGDIVVQTNQVLTNLARVLDLVGSSLLDVLMARSFLRAESDFPAYDECFRAWFPDRLPSRTTVVVSGFAVKGALVEIDLVAALMQKR